MAQWNIPLFYSVLKTSFPSVNFSDLLSCLDDPSMVIPPEGFAFVYHVYCCMTDELIPFPLLYTPWKNPLQQIQFLNALMFLDTSAFTGTSVQIVDMICLVDD